MSEFARDSEHVSFWLGAYLDGELTAALRMEIEQHLAGCAACSSELEQLRGLSNLLQAHTLPQDWLQSVAFQRAVLRRIRPPREQAWRRFLHTCWRYAPLVLFALWAFVQAVTWTASALLLGLRYLPGLQANLPAFRALTQASGWISPEMFRGQAQELAASLFQIGSLSMPILVSFVLGLLIAGMFLAWLASWMAYQRTQPAAAPNNYAGLDVEG